MTETYSFPDKVNFIENGVPRHDKTLIEPGQPARLKFIGSGTAKKSKITVRGMVVQFDSYTGKGTLRQGLTNRLIPFKFAADLMKDRANLPGAGAVVEFTDTTNEGNVASLH